MLLFKLICQGWSRCEQVLSNEIRQQGIIDLNSAEAVWGWSMYAVQGE